ncbi:MAG TPA: glycine cleavage T C-terminal barrel domain-containing protein [Vicinamibacterales bacterium]|nr:glycine cleavage T C-terminal barrel domain-containing protein [Vicinamibacterales bacterium]
MFSLDGYKAALARGGVVRRTDRGVLAVSGGDRASWLQGLVTNDVAALHAGEHCYAAYLTPQGRMITDMHVFAERERMLLDVPAPLAASLRDRLDGLIFAEDVAVTDESARVHVWTVIDKPEGLSPPESGGLSPHVGDSLPPELAPLAEIDLDTFEVIRIERGVPRFLADMDETTIPLEAGIEDRAISFTKGCYVGQEIIVRVTHRGGGRVAKRLVPWHAGDNAAVVPTRDAKLFAGDREVGRVTSAAFSPGLNRIVGLGYLHRDFAERGTNVTVVWNDARIEAVVQ